MALDLEKEKYLESKTEEMVQSWMRISAIFGIVFFLALTALDHFVTPENFIRFLIYRLSIAFFLFLLLLLNEFKRKLYYQYFLIVTGIVASAVAIELMILHFGGHRSIYYAGINLLILCVLGVLPLNLPISLFVAALLYFIYLVPILAYDTIIDQRTFINNNVFILATICVAFVWRVLSQQSITKALELQYELDEDKKQLQKYSTQLEELVEERTKELSISEQRYRALFDNANDGIVVLDKNGTIVSVNNSYCELYGFERGTLIGTSFKLLEAKDSEAEVRERMGRILGGESLVYETEHYKRDGNKILVEISSRAINIGGELYVQSFHRDIAEKKRLQEQLFQSQKMESIGVLAGGIAHDFNNILTAILAHTDMLQEFSNLDAAGKKRVKTIEMSARRAGQLVSKLLRFARQASFDAVPIDLNAIVRDSAELIERMVKKQHIVLKVETTDASSVVQGDSTQIEQVIMNLVVNAGDAMPHGGTITISTTVENLGRDASRVHPLLTPGRYVRLVVSDTGMGIPEQIRDKIFDPFFTTKETGKGTGLGLATVYGIVKEHKGIINLRTEVGRGTTFEIFFPASRATPLSPVTIHTTGKGPFSGEQEKT
jgi:PAS domain S-box-containing protein